MVIPIGAKTAEIARIQSPIKKEIRHLDGSSQKAFPELLEKVAQRLRKCGYKLFHTTKSYRKNGNICSDNFWRKEKKIDNVKIIWTCKFTISFEGGFKFKFDFDFWFDFSKLLQNIKGELHEIGFPFTERDYARKFGEEEADKILQEIKEEFRKKMRRSIAGWGKHGIRDEVSERKSSAICHLEEISISSISELENLRKTLPEVEEEPIELTEDCAEELEELGREKIRNSIPFSIESESLEGHLAFFLWFRDPGGGFEYQLYRFVQENYGVTRKEEVRDALLRLEVHGYANVRETPEELGKKLRKRGINRHERFYEIGEKEIPGRKLFGKLKRRTDIGAYLAPLPKKRLVRHLDAPDHIVNEKVRKLARKNYLSRKRVKDFSGRTVRKLKSRRSPKDLSGLKEKIVNKSFEFYNVQKESLDQMQDGRPQV